MNCKEFQTWLTCRDIRDAVLPRAVADHLAACRSCEALFHGDSCLENLIAQGLDLAEPPKRLAEQISVSLEHQDRFPLNRARVAAGMAALVVLMVMGIYLFSGIQPARFKDLNQISRQAVQDHLAGNRQMSFNASHLDQALATLTQTLGFRVLLPDLSQYDCILLGGRLCALGKCRAAYFVLEREGRAGSLFIMDTGFLNFDMADNSRFITFFKGCQAWVWKDNGQVYAMVF